MDKSKPTRCIDPVMKCCHYCKYGCVHSSYDWDDDYYETSCMYDLEDTEPTEEEKKEFDEWANRRDNK